MDSNKTNPSHVAILVVVIIIAGIMLFYSMKSDSYTDSVEATPTTTAETQESPRVEREVSSTDLTLKAEILKTVSTGEVLTAKEKTEIYAAISGDNINKYNFTPEEMKKIIEALNRK